MSDTENTEKKDLSPSQDSNWAPPPPPDTPTSLLAIQRDEVKIDVMPDTGHHYHFIPFDDQHLRLNEKEWFRDIEKTCRSGNVGWQNVEGYKWIRFKPGERKLKEFGIWLAIESNLGTNNRGSVYISAEECEEFELKEQPEAPYAYSSADRVPPQSEGKRITVPLTFLQKTQSESSSKLPSIEFDVHWVTALANRPIEVDLIVDFGNTRTTCLLLEDTPEDGSTGEQALVRRVQSLRFNKRGTCFDKDSGETIINSWFLAHETEFSEFEPPVLAESESMEFFHTRQANEKSGSNIIKTIRDKLSADGIESQNKGTTVFAKTKLVPQMFVETSPVLLGPDTAKKLSGANLAGGGKCFLSSPKRYAWDNYSNTEATQLYWTMLRNSWSKENTSTANPKLQASVLRMFPANGFDWDATSPPWEWDVHLRPHSNPMQPVYPNGDSLSWMALGILEQSLRQINDPSYWENNYPFIPRKLRSVQVTYPSGWTEPELNAYMSKWNKAVNAFNSSHLQKESVLKLEFPIDEGVASQLPVIFSEIESMGRIGENWISLIGREPQEGFPKARVMTIDIGGGTTDFAIVEYEDQKQGPGVDLHASLLLKDSSSIAGDQMIREIIESVLLPKLGDQHRDDSEWREVFEDLFKEGINNNVDREYWKTITRLGFIPRVVEWISDIVEKRRPRARSASDLDIVSRRLAHFAELKDIQGLDLEEPLNITTEEINESIEKTFNSLFIELSKFASAFDVDCLVVCGKPSEIPKVSEMLQNHLPVNPLRIIVANEYKIGNWYPFSVGGRIQDAKTLTAVGVCLYKAIRSNMLSGWNVTLKNSLVNSYRNCWEIIHEKLHCESILSSEQDENTVRLMNNARIGRRLLKDANPEFVYQLKYKGQGELAPAQFDASFRRKPAANDYVSEGLELVNVTGRKNDGSDLSISDFELKLCTLESNEYWIDEARFNVDWGDEGVDDDWRDF